MISPVLRCGERLTFAPVIHGTGECALAVRRLMLAESFDCVAVPLPPSFQADVERAIGSLPTPSLVLQRAAPEFGATAFGEEYSEAEDEDLEQECSYVPIDPCQPVIMALRVALGERQAIRFIDLETNRFEAHSAVLPDAYALKQVAWERFVTALLPAIPPPSSQQARQRIQHMAWRLRELQQRYRSVLCVCSVLDWPWLREACRAGELEPVEGDEVAETEPFGVDPATLLFLCGELPWITGLYERARDELEDDEGLSVDGVKELLLEARDRYRREKGRRARRITPLLLSQCLKYVRNLTLLDRRFTPDLYSLVTAAKQVMGDQFALQIAEAARHYPGVRPLDLTYVRMGINRAAFPDGTTARMVSRLPGPPVVWRSCQLQRRPERVEVEKWRLQWNPFSQCSWPPEDNQIESFRAHVFDRALGILGADLARTEKFTTSLQDGLDIRETLRHWYDGQLYVKVLPPSRGKLDCVVMLFDAPVDPREYPWRTTWFAEHQNESTLAFFATDFRREIVGPGIGLATYGGAMFLFPPVPIPDIWTDPRLDFVETLEERLLAAACLHSQCRHVALLSSAPPGPGWRRLAKRFRRQLVHVPLGQFGDSTIQQLRMAHVLNGREVRSYAAHFIRRS